jgi:hypothetical protein
MKQTFTHKIYFVCLALVILPLWSFGQNAAISGYVVNSYSRVSINDVTVFLKGTAYKTQTDSTGYYEMKNLPPAVYTVVFEKPEYIFRTEQQIDALKPGEQRRFNAAVYPELIDLPTAEIVAAKANAAGNISTITALRMELRPRMSAQDMLQNVSGLFTAQHQGGGKAEQIFFRGFDCDHGTDICVNVDDVPVNMPSHGHGQGYADLHFLIPETVKSLDVYNGPFEAQFGDFATSGSVMFNTYDTLPNSMVRLEAGSAPTQRAFSNSRLLVLLNIPTGLRNVTAYVGGEYGYSPGYFDYDSKYSRFNAYGKMKIAMANNAALTFSLSTFSATWNGSGQIPERAVTEGIIDRFGSLDPSEGGTTQKTTLNLEYVKNTPTSQFKTNVFFTDYHFKLFTDFTFFLVDSVHGDGIEQDDDRDVLGFHSSYRKNYMLGNVRASTTFGIGFRGDYIHEQVWHQEDRTRLNVEANTQSYEYAADLYATEELTFSRKFRMNFTIRGDAINFNLADLTPIDTLTHKDLSGYNYMVLPEYKLNLIYSPANYVQLFANNGIGFHSNDIRIVVQDPTNHLLPVAFAEEVGATFRIGTRAVITTELWMLSLTSERTYDPDVAMEVDLGATNRKGADVTATVQILPWLSWDADLNLARGRRTDGFFGKRTDTAYFLPLAPTLVSQSGFTVQLKNGFKARLEYRAMAARSANDDYSVTAHGYIIMNATVAYATRKYQVGVYIKNLLNTNWYEAQFETVTRIKMKDGALEPYAMDDDCYTAGTPFAPTLFFELYLSQLGPKHKPRGAQEGL